MSAVEFGPTGEYLATGDKGGRVVVFKQSARTKELAQAQGKVAYSFYTEFQSHEPEFDYLKSLEIEEKINCIRWYVCSSFEMIFDFFWTFFVFVFRSLSPTHQNIYLILSSV